MLGTSSTIHWVLEKSKETILEFYKGTVKVYKKLKFSSQNFKLKFSSKNL